MCRECVVTVRPDRGRTCLETGAFVLNYAGCSACQHRSSIKAVGREVSEDEQDNGDYEETVTFQRQHHSPHPRRPLALLSHSAVSPLSSLLRHRHVRHCAGTPLLNIITPSQCYAPASSRRRAARVPDGVRLVRSSRGHVSRHQRHACRRTCSTAASDGAAAGRARVASSRSTTAHGGDAVDRPNADSVRSKRDCLIHSPASGCG